jgi:hypothetical protein
VVLLLSLHLFLKSFLFSICLVNSHRILLRSEIVDEMAGDNKNKTKKSNGGVPQFPCAFAF